VWTRKIFIQASEIQKDQRAAHGGTSVLGAGIALGHQGQNDKKQQRRFCNVPVL